MENRARDVIREVRHDVVRRRYERHEVQVERIGAEQAERARAALAMLSAFQCLGMAEPHKRRHVGVHFEFPAVVRAKPFDHRGFERGTETILDPHPAGGH